MVDSNKMAYNLQKREYNNQMKAPMFLKNFLRCYSETQRL